MFDMAKYLEKLLKKGETVLKQKLEVDRLRKLFDKPGADTDDIKKGMFDRISDRLFEFMDGLYNMLHCIYYSILCIKTLQIAPGDKATVEFRFHSSAV